MNSEARILDPSFVASQRHKLVARREEILRTMDGLVNEDSLRNLALHEEAHEREDQAQDQDKAEKDDSLLVRMAAEQAAIDRAIAKIDEGTYGSSDLSGEAIPMARLLALPQATRTTDEEAEHQYALDHAGARPLSATPAAR